MEPKNHPGEPLNDSVEPKNHPGEPLNDFVGPKNHPGEPLNDFAEPQNHPALWRDGYFVRQLESRVFVGRMMTGKMMIQNGLGHYFARNHFT